MEFDNLFSSTFYNDKLAIKIITALAKRKKGYTRKELVEILKISDGDIIGNCLKALVYSDFVMEYVPFLEKKNAKYYKVIDPFCLFYLKFAYNRKSLNKDLFYDLNNTSWVGHAFENLCSYHFIFIKEALGIKGINAMLFSWCYEGSRYINGAQIDLIIERKDNIISLCEMKFYNKEYKVDKKEHLNLMNKIEILKANVAKKYTIVPTLITTLGLEKSDYFDDYNMVITLDDLLK